MNHGTVTEQKTELENTKGDQDSFHLRLSYTEVDRNVYDCQRQEIGCWYLGHRNIPTKSKLVDIC